jgi:surfeit locus 1 family protein
MKLGSRSIVVIAVLVTLVFLRFGFWQLSRLHDRRVLNAELASRAVQPAVPISSLPVDTAQAHYRRVRVAGTYDYAHEIILSLRSRNGSPGVNLVTPLKLPGSDSAVLVVRGWVYAPDGMTVNLSRWREGQQENGTGFVETFPPPRNGHNRSPTKSYAYRWLDRSELERRFGYPLAPFYVVLTNALADSSRNAPPRLTVPPMDEGPHQSYAIQWFSFAAISIIGTTLFVRRK